MLKLKKFFKRNRYIYLLAQRFHFIIKKIYCITVKIFCIGLEPKVVFSSFKGKTYSDSPKAISEKLHEKYPEIKIVWLFKDVKAKQKIVPSYVKCVKAGTLRERSELYTAKCWIDNFPKESCEIKTKKQLYIQTFHGDRAIKKVGFDKKAEHGKVIDMLETKKCDLFLAGSDMGEHVARSAFRYSGTVLKIGIPRNDILIKQSSEKIHNITEKLGGGGEKRFLLYAPTFRDEAKGKIQKVPCLDIDTILEHLEKIKPGKWYCLIRAHSAVKRLDGINPRKNIIDVTEYEDMADLLLISDVLITDYSSTAGDFILQNKPVILYQPDYKEYLEKDRTFYFEAEKLPYWIAHSMSEIYKYIDDFSEKSILENCNKVKEFYKICESGHASEEVADYIYHYISGNQEGISLNVR